MLSPEGLPGLQLLSMGNYFTAAQTVNALAAAVTSVHEQSPTAARHLGVVEADAFTASFHEHGSANPVEDPTAAHALDALAASGFTASVHEHGSTAPPMFHCSRNGTTLWQRNMKTEYPSSPPLSARFRAARPQTTDYRAQAPPTNHPIHR